MSRGNPVIHNTSGWGNFTKCPNFGGWAHLAWVRRMGPVHFSHINFRGTIAFELERFLDDLLQRMPTTKKKTQVAPF